MNLLENYLIEVVRKEPFVDEDWSNEEWAKDKEFIWVTATFECYGRVETHKRVYSTQEWKEIEKNGYYMG